MHGAVAAHLPALQALDAVQAKPSSQGVASATFTNTHLPVATSQESAVHAKPSSHLSRAPAAQLLLPSQVSPLVQRLPSLQGPLLLACRHKPVLPSQLSSVHTLPSSQLIAGAYTQLPLFASQESLVHKLASSQFFALPLTHLPPAQTSPIVQPLASSHRLLLPTHEQTPVIGSHRSLVQTLPSSQSVALPPWHLAAEQCSPVVQTLLSSQATALLACTQPALGSQLSSVHKLLSSHFFKSIGLPLVHAGPLPGTTPQMSPIVQALASSHGNTLGAHRQPVLPSQASLVQTLPSSQLVLAPLEHLPTVQVDGPTHRSPGAHGLPSAKFVCKQPMLLSQVSAVQGVLSAQSIFAPATHFVSLHVENTHLSPVEQGARLPGYWQPLTGSQLSSVQTLPSVQTLAAPAHLPAAHKSLSVQALPSSQAATLLADAQPVLPSQVSSVQALPSLQSLAGPALHLPWLQPSPVVQTLPSSQGLPVADAKKPHNPLLGSQPSLVHGLPSSQSTLLAPAQMPAAHLSPLVHKLASSQAIVLLAWTHPVLVSHLSSVQTLLSSHLTASPVQLPALQASFVVQAFASSHLPALGELEQTPALQLSSVQLFLSSQFLAAPTQAPALHASLAVHKSPSSQITPSPLGVATQVPATQFAVAHDPALGQSPSILQATGTSGLVSAAFASTPFESKPLESLPRMPSGAASPPVATSTPTASPTAPSLSTASPTAASPLAASPPLIS